MTEKIRPLSSRWPWLVLILAALAIGLHLADGGGAGRASLAAPTASPAGAYLTARWGTVTPQLLAYGQVEPIAVLPLNAAEAGVVSGLTATPGAHVAAGQMIAHLEGPEIRSLLLQDRTGVRSSIAQLRAAQTTLQIQQQQLGVHLSTHQAVHQAENAVAQAQAGLANAQARLRAAQQMATVTAPIAATVLAVNAGVGQRVSVGETILTLRGDDQLWLQANYYGRDRAAVRVGVRGSFVPADRSPPVPVRVVAVLDALAADGGAVVALLPLSPRSAAARAAAGASWSSGEFGSVRLHASSRRLVAVPTRALILDRGHWWVLVRTLQGLRPQAVVPGPAEGWQTFLESGLAPGAQVVVANAYLLFHSGIAQRYQLPD